MTDIVRINWRHEILIVEPKHPSELITLKRKIIKLSKSCLLKSVTFPNEVVRENDHACFFVEQSNRDAPKIIRIPKCHFCTYYTMKWNFGKCCRFCIQKYRIFLSRKLHLESYQGSKQRVGRVYFPWCLDEKSVTQSRDAPSDLKRLLPLIAFPSRGSVTPLSEGNEVERRRISWLPPSSF